MIDTLRPQVAWRWKGPPAQAGSPSLMTPLGLIEGDVLTYLEEHGETTLRRLVRDLEWPSSLVTMAVGALVREGLARAVQHELEVAVEATAASRPTAEREPADGPDVWRG